MTKQVFETLCPLFGYILGSIPFGLLFSVTFGDGKLQHRGSKNIGATNVFRTQGKIMGVATFLCDFSKGFLPCYFLRSENEVVNLLTLASPVIGHMFPIWLKFKGGKGIATYLGVLYALSPFVGGGTTVIWLCMFRILRISAAAGIISVVTSLVIFNYTRIAMCWDFLNHLYVLIGLVALIIAKHYDNLKRMMEKIRSA